MLALSLPVPVSVRYYRLALRIWWCFVLALLYCNVVIIGYFNVKKVGHLGILLNVILYTLGSTLITVRDVVTAHLNWKARYHEFWCKSDSIWRKINSPNIIFSVFLVSATFAGGFYYTCHDLTSISLERRSLGINQVISVVTFILIYYGLIVFLMKYNCLVKLLGTLKDTFNGEPRTVQPESLYSECVKFKNHMLFSYSICIWFWFGSTFCVQIVIIGNLFVTPSGDTRQPLFAAFYLVFLFLLADVSHRAEAAHCALKMSLRNVEFSLTLNRKDPELLKQVRATLRKSSLQSFAFTGLGFFTLGRHTLIGFGKFAIPMYAMLYQLSQL